MLNILYCNKYSKNSPKKLNLFNNIIDVELSGNLILDVGEVDGTELGFHPVNI